MTSPIVNEAVEIASAVAPNDPVVEVAEAAVNTVANPSPENILSDLELAITLVKQLKASLASSHPSVSKIIKRLI